MNENKQGKLRMSAVPLKRLVSLDWHCGYAVGEPYWQMQGDWVHEPDECGEEFTTEHTEEEIKEGVTVKCPNCGGELSTDYDCPEVSCIG